MDFRDELDRCENFGDIFELVKKAVEKVLGRRRAGLMLVLADLPMNVGAFHGVGSNAIVMNRRLLDAVVKNNGSMRDVNSFVFSILLHEYLHSLGYIEEQEVRPLVIHISRQIFGEDHPTTRISSEGPMSLLARIPLHQAPDNERDVQIVDDFDRSSTGYIS
jgi:hypothetical protein